MIETQKPDWKEFAYWNAWSLNKEHPEWFTDKVEKDYVTTTRVLDYLPWGSPLNLSNIELGIVLALVDYAVYHDIEWML